MALFHGHRVLYTLLMWKANNWPALAVCQLLRARMELEAGLIGGDMFLSVRESVQEFVLGSGPSIPYRPVKYQTTALPEAYRGPLAIMLLPEIPFTEHETAAPARSHTHRRGSLDVLLQAIEAVGE